MTAGRTYAGLRKRHALQLFKTDMCKFFLQNRCEHGDKCHYAHHIDEVRLKPDLTRTSMCKSMVQRGMCTDMGCRFAHSEAELRATHGFFKMKMCGFAQSGRCKHGDSCRFAHSPEELRPMVPQPLGGDGDMLQRQEEQVQMPAMPSHMASRSRPDGPQMSVPQDCQIKNFIFGDAHQSVVPPPPPPPCVPPPTGPPPSGPPPGPPPNKPEASAARKHQRQSHQQQQQPHQQQQQQQQAQPWRPGRRTVDESDSADASSWASGSSATEVPRSEHTGSPLQTTSDSGSGAGATSGGTANPASGSGSATVSISARAGPSGTKAKRRETAAAAAQGIGGGGGGGPDDAPVTTLIITNVPAYFTQGALLSMLEDLTFEMRGNYDFYYCPWDESLEHNLGYALINFLTGEGASAFQQTWSNKELCRGGRGHKPLRVMKAPVQGLEANMNYFSRNEVTPCSDRRFRPLYRKNGVLVPLAFKEPEEHCAKTDPPKIVQVAGHGKSGGRPCPRGPGKAPAPSPGSLLPEPPPTTLAGQAPRRRGQHWAVELRRSSGEAVPSWAAASATSLMSQLQQPYPQQPPQQQQHHARPPRRGNRHSEQQDHQVPDPVMDPVYNQGQSMGECQRGFQPMMQLEEYWPKAPGVNEDVHTNDQQQVYSWPVMMTAMPWPVADQGGKGSSQHNQPHPCMQDNVMMSGDGSHPRMNGSSGSAGNGCMPGGNQMQVSYQQLLPYMMMPMEAMVPVDGARMEQSNMPTGNMMMPHMQIQGWSNPDEVYTD